MVYTYSCKTKKFDSWLLSLIIIITFFSCSNPNESSTTGNLDDNVLQINLNNFPDKKGMLRLSEIADTIEYIVLETPPGIIISSIRSVEKNERNIFVLAKGVVYRFDSLGKFINKIGNRGRGPGEYIVASDFSIDWVKSRVIVSSYPDILFYNFDGRFIKKMGLRALGIAFQNGNIYGSLETLGMEKNQLVGVNENSDTLIQIPNFLFFKENRNFITGSTAKFAYPFYRHNKDLFFIGEEENDTIWKINGGNYTKFAYVNLGKYKLPLKYNPSYSLENYDKKGGDYYSIIRITEDERFLYLTGKPRGKGGLYSHCIIYNKKDQDLFCSFYNTIPGIYDDILGGPPFWPYYINDNYYIGCMEAFELITYAEKNGDNIKEGLKKIINNINENTNQLLILCKIKD